MIARHRPFFLDHAFIFFLVAYAFAPTSAIESLEQATSSCAWQTVRKVGGSDCRSIHEEWREDFRQSYCKTKKQIKELVYNIPATYTF